MYDKTLIILKYVHYNICKMDSKKGQPRLVNLWKYLILLKRFTKPCKSEDYCLSGYGRNTWETLIFIYLRFVVNNPVSFINKLLSSDQRP